MDYTHPRGAQSRSRTMPGKPSIVKGSSARDPPSPHTALALELLGEVKDLKAAVTGAGAAYVPILPSSASAVSGTRPYDHGHIERHVQGRGRAVSRAGGGGASTQASRMQQYGQEPSRSRSRSQSRSRHASGYSPEGRTPSDGLRKELGRVTAAYGELVREHRAAKGLWAERETALVTEVGKLKGQVSTLERLRREAAEAATQAKAAARSQAVQEQDVAALRVRVEELSKSKARAERSSAEHLSSLKELQARMAEQSALFVAAEGSRARTAALTQRADASEGRVRELTQERDSLLDFVSDLQSRLSDSLRACADLQERAVLAEHLDGRVCELTAQLGRAQAEVVEARAKQEAADGRALTLSESAVRASTLESVQKDLLHTVSLQAQEIQHLQGMVQDSSKDGKRVHRLEKALEAYRRVEKTFTERTGQGFFGVNGLAYELGVDVRGSSAVQAAAGRPSGSSSLSRPGAAASELAEIAFCPDDADFEPALARFLSQLQESVRAELRGQYESERQQEKAAVLARAAEAEKQLIACQQERAKLTDALRAEQSWRSRVQDMEGELAQLVLASRSAGQGQGEGSAPQGDVSPADAADPDLSATNTLYSTDWHVLPSLVHVLPRLSAVMGRMKADLHSAVRRRKLAEGEAQDLREELALLRGEDVAVAASHKVASLDIRRAIQAGKEERVALKHMADELTGELAGAVGRIAELENQLARVTAESTELTAKASAQGAEIAAGQQAVLEAAGERDRLRSLAALHEQRVVEGKQMNEEIFALLGQRHSQVEQHKAELRRLRAKGMTLLGPDVCLQLFGPSTSTPTVPGGDEGGHSHRCTCGCPVCGRGNEAACSPSTAFSHLRAPTYAYYGYSAATIAADGVRGQVGEQLEARKQVPPQASGAHGGSPLTTRQQPLASPPSPRPPPNKETQESSGGASGGRASTQVQHEGATSPVRLQGAPAAHRQEEIVRLQEEARQRAEEARAAADELVHVKALLAQAQAAATSPSLLLPSRGSGSPDLPAGVHRGEAQGLGGTQGSTVTIVKHASPPAMTEAKSQGSPCDEHALVHSFHSNEQAQSAGTRAVMGWSGRGTRDVAFLGPDDDDAPAQLKRASVNASATSDEFFVSPPTTAAVDRRGTGEAAVSLPAAPGSDRRSAAQASIRSANRASTPAEGRFASRLLRPGPGEQGARVDAPRSPRSAESHSNSSRGSEASPAASAAKLASTGSRLRTVLRGAGTGSPVGRTPPQSSSRKQRDDMAAQSSGRTQGPASGIGDRSSGQPLVGNDPQWRARSEASGDSSGSSSSSPLRHTLRFGEERGSPARGPLSAPAYDPAAAAMAIASPSTAAELRATAALITRRVLALSVTPPSPPATAAHGEEGEEQGSRVLQRSPIAAGHAPSAHRSLMNQSGDASMRQHAPRAYNDDDRARSLRGRDPADSMRDYLHTVPSITVQHSAPALGGYDAPQAADVERAKRAARASAALARRSSVADVAEALGLPSGLLSHAAAATGSTGQGNVLSVTVSSKGRRASVSVDL